MSATERPTLDVLMARIVARFHHHDPVTRAAARLVCDSILRHKIAPYVEDDGWIDWTRLAADLITGLPWSGGEKRLARIACSLSGQLLYLDDHQLDDLDHLDATAMARILSSWSLAECLHGLDDAGRTAVTDALHDAIGSTSTTSSTPRTSGGGR